MKITIAGAGAIGCFTGALLSSRHSVTLLGRPYVLDPVRQNGLHVTDFGGLDEHVPADQIATSTCADSLAGADLVIVTVKSGGTASIAEDIAGHVSPDTPVLSWQNGLKPVQDLRSKLPRHDVRAGMVPFNVVPKGAGHYHRATSGEIVIENGSGELPGALDVPHLPVLGSDRIAAVQWGKLVVNLNNALNALSGMTLKRQLLDRNWRRVMANQMAEALRILKTAGIEVASTTPLPAWANPYMLRLPTPLFSRIAARMITIDPEARTSMAYDLEAGRKTEVADLQGEILTLAQRHSCQAPICSQVMQAVRDAEGKGPGCPGLKPEIFDAS
ncbi:2-dehydropantoate 2-reductase [Primorskyibacter sp. S87]|uniref:2-dehydropantoate 2-reductase n=1 Tax=Primorskyibacter sp. S87 TaxID=3415126 RepID=UPI003C7DBE3E